MRTKRSGHAEHGGAKEPDNELRDSLLLETATVRAPPEAWVRPICARASGWNRGPAIVAGVNETAPFDLLAEMDMLCVISNRPADQQPLQGFDPTPIEVFVTSESTGLFKKTPSSG